VPASGAGCSDSRGARPAAELPANAAGSLQAGRDGDEPFGPRSAWRRPGCKPGRSAGHPHQGHFRIVDAVGAADDVGLEHFIINLDRYGNTSSACMPIALHETNMTGKLDRGDWS